MIYLNNAIAQQVAKAFVDDPNILGVIGHHSSNTTMAAGSIYGKNGLVAPAPGSKLGYKFALPVATTEFK